MEVSIARLHYCEELTVKRVPGKDSTGLDGTTHFFDPLVIKGHPRGLVGKTTGLDTVPKLGRFAAMVADPLARF